MLRRAASVVALATLLVAPTLPAAAAGDVTCPVDLPNCIVTVEDPGSSGSATGGPTTQTGSTTGARVCRLPLRGTVVDCYDDNWGWFSNVDGCYYRVRDPQPPAADPVWQGRHPDGAVYVVTCMDAFGGPGTNGGWTWLASPPDGFGAPSVTPGELAQRAVDQMALTGPSIGTTVEGGELGMVGVPVWLWTEVTPMTWGPTTATAAVPGLAVTATAQAIQIAWDMGDGTTFVCANPGTPYISGEVHSPTCEHVYTWPSIDELGEAYTVTGTTTWSVSWTGAGTSGALTVTRTAQTSVRIGELQVLVSG